ncbi:uncharacterized protein LOC127734578 isoform X2 [Mytilus californianus]|uniref:uncharacterized protein LOC127734578 isoform X2 n=1 Tax=Mytilus californianus TaxID=6549 RepID=UPI00224749C4|nr:uncharacterized protein LOC127734578 isoform X2 [Mytilus californianus]
MPSKRKHGKTSRTHIFQRSTRSTRSRTRSCSQPKVKASTEIDIPEQLKLPVENGSDIEYNREEENNENHTDVEPEEQTDNDSSEVSTFEKQDERNEKTTPKISLATKNSKTVESGSLSEDVIEVSPSVPVLCRSRNRARSPRRAHRYKSYSHEMLVAAYKCVKDLKMPVKAAARMFGVPSSTLHNRVQGQVQIDDSILTSEDITKIIKRIRNGEGLDEAFADLTYEKSNGSLGREYVIPSIEEDINDDNITESIMEKMIAAGEGSENTAIKEEIIDPEYEYQMNGSMQESDDNTSLHNMSDEIYRNQQHRRRSYKRNYKTYSYEQLVAAYLYVKEKKVAVKFAARAFGVPPSTLNDRVQGKVYIDTSIVMNRPGARKILPKPNLHLETKFVNKNTEQDSNQSENQSDQDSEPATPDAGDSSDVSQMTKEAYDAIEQRPEFQNIFKKHKCRDQYRKYTQEQLMEACKYSMETKASYREVSEKFGIPQSTLRDKLHAVEKLNTDVGQPPIKKARTESTETKTSTESSTMVLSPEIPDNNSDSDKLNAASNDRSNYRQYSKDSLTTAAHYVMKFNTPIMKAARMFGVPASTLKDHVRNKLPQDTEQLTQPSTPSLINDRDERKLIEYIKMMEKCGFILTTKEIIEFGSELASASQEIEGSITLSDSWYLDFVKRWPPLGMVNREGRSPIPQDIKKYFMELNKIFNKHKFFERPELVYVMDEVDITLEYNPLKLVPRKRFSRSNQCKTTQQKLTSVVGCSNGLGTTLPPYYVLQSDEIVTDVISQSPPGTQAMFANTVRKDCSTLRDYFQNHFMRFAQSGRNTQNRFVLVFYDSRRTNLNVSDIDWAKRWHILLFPLPHPIKKEEESAREILNGIFQNYGDDVEEERSKFVKQKGYMAVSMPDICGILGKAYRKSLTYAHISSCFESYGIYPLNPRNYVSRLDASFQLKLHDLQAMPNYETNLWLLSDFSCTQAVNNAIESSFNSSEGNNLYCRGENNARYVKHNNSGTESSNCNANNQTSSGYSQDSAAFNTSYQGLINHLMVQAVRDNSQIEPQILNGVAIKTEPQMDFGYGQVTVTPQIQESYSQQQYILESSISSASNESQNTQNCQVVPQMYLYQNGSESCNSLNNGTTENQDTNTASASNDDLTNNSQVVMQAKSKCESSSSSRRKGKSYRVIVNEPEPENETTDKQLSDDIAENPPPESNKIFSKSKLDTCRKTSRLGSLLDEKVRKLHEQAKASSEVVEDLDEPLMKIGEFQIVMNKGE